MANKEIKDIVLFKLSALIGNAAYMSDMAHGSLNC